ncbi:ImmA/IrrE family metallo-endopeptidase [Tsukamurella columbiensis]|uniref:ImmA/IrrE family metallo-endopeptidase n=1 Tax=Tsukamurella columbiensis TaxID=128509 RepID=A0ABX1LIE1_9ACTN|nr:ImmA/IrrE family metallo-endopeptidase [Tsukamurella columbiensis]NMD58002.1 ImmA/IrrE family metallo-endopeptidase [Tsukamurella columbiensis]
MWFRSFGSKSKPSAPEDDEYLVKRALFGPSELSPEIKARARQNASIALDSIEFRRPWTIEAFVMQVSIDRARPVIVMDNNLLVGATRTTGFWRPTSTADYIHVSADVSEQAKEFIILHELGHILCGHPRPAVSGPDHPPMKKFAYDEFPTVPASLIDELNGATRDMHQANPCTYSVLEIEAEWFALLASDRADSYRRPTVASNAPRRTQEILDYYQRGLGW